MPAMNGFELLQKLRSLNVPQAKNIPVIAITARSDMDETDFCTKGFEGCLHKPFNQTELLKIFKACTSTNHQEFLIQEEQTHTHKKTTGKYNFSLLTAFAGNDSAAAHEILETFIGETSRNYERMKQALKAGNITDICAIAHKMLPTFTMIGASKAVSALQWLEFNRSNAKFTDEAKRQTETALECITDVIAEAHRANAINKKL